MLPGPCQPCLQSANLNLKLLSSISTPVHSVRTLPSCHGYGQQRCWKVLHVNSSTCLPMHACLVYLECHCMDVACACRLLNGLPANRTTATALHAFLQTAGFRMHQVFKGQFVKLLQCIYDEFRLKLDQVSFCLAATFNRCTQSMVCCVAIACCRVMHMPCSAAGTMNQGHPHVAR